MPKSLGMTDPVRSVDQYNIYHRTTEAEKPLLANPASIIHKDSSYEQEQRYTVELGWMVDRMAELKRRDPGNCTPN